MPITEEQLLQIAQSKGLDVSKFAPKLVVPSKMPSEQSRYGGISGLLSKISPTLGNMVGDAARGFSGKETAGNEYDKLYREQMIKKSFEDPVDNRLKEARIKAIDAGLTVDESGNITKAPPARDPDYIPPSIEARKIKATDELYDTAKETRLNYGKIKQGMAAADKLPQGLLGGWKMKWMNWTGSKDPSLADWQNMKSLLLDAQLQNVAKTKGSISNSEMALFAQAVANDDIPNAMRQTKVLEAFQNAIFAEQDSKVNAFKRSFNDDPRTWEDLNLQSPDNVGGNNELSAIEAELAEINRALSNG